MVQKKSMKKKLIIITGPTGIGKSALAVELSEKFNGSIIGCDSMQIYKNLDIGTGKITSEEKKGIEHFMIDIAEPDEYFTAFNYIEQAKPCIDKILANNKLPFLVGGTGLYITGLLRGNNFAQVAKNEKIRTDLENLAEKNGLEYVYKYLLSVDPQSAAKISANDKKRILRALEIYESTGIPKSQSATFSSDCEYDYLLFVIIPHDRQGLYNNINRRVDKMFESGLLEEVKNLMPYKSCNSMQAIGYKEIVDFLEGKINLKNAIEHIKQATRHYAKRQLTYFKHMPFEKYFIEKNRETMNVISDIIRTKI